MLTDSQIKETLKTIKNIYPNHTVYPILADYPNLFDDMIEKEKSSIVIIFNRRSTYHIFSILSKLVKDADIHIAYKGNSHMMNYEKHIEYFPKVVNILIERNGDDPTCCVCLLSKSVKQPCETCFVDMCIECLSKHLHYSRQCPQCRTKLTGIYK